MKEWKTVVRPTLSNSDWCVKIGCSHASSNGCVSSGVLESCFPVAVELLALLVIVLPFLRGLGPIFFLYGWEDDLNETSSLQAGNNGPEPVPT